MSQVEIGVEVNKDDSNDHVVIDMTDIFAPPAQDEFDDNTPDKAAATPPTTSSPAYSAKKKNRNKRPDVAWTNSAALSREQRDEEFDQDMLRRAIADTGRWAYGTISVEAWVLDEQTGKLSRPKRAFWFDPVVVEEGKDNEAIMRLVDETREDFVRPDDLAPGVGLAGALWAELSQSGGMGQMGMPPRNNITTSGRGTLLFGNGLLADALGPKHHVAWREVEPISNDPDQPFNLRLQLAAKAGIGLAAGVKFQFRGVQGLVVYMARNTTDITKLKSDANEEYLLSAADVIGSIVCLRGPRRACLTKRRADREEVRRRVRNKMVAFIRIGGSFLKESCGVCPPVETSQASSQSAVGKKLLQPETAGRSVGNLIKSKLILISTKLRGANNEPPPPMETSESIWSFMGVLLTLLALLEFSDAITKRNPEYGLIIGPFGALMTLQFCLTAAPASQPRNAILGQAVAISIAMGMTYTSLPTNLRRSLGTALAIMSMARLGITHPPAGAAALIVTGGGYTWAHLGIMLAGNLISVFFATLINDMNIKRQYPTSWGFGYWHKHFIRNGKKKA